MEPKKVTGEPYDKKDFNRLSHILQWRSIFLTIRKTIS